MITPFFTVDQNDDFVIITIKVVQLKTQNVEIFVDGELFIFSLPPYYLRLRLPGKLVDDEDRGSAAHYDISKSSMVVKIPKETRGEVFKDLDLITKLLARQGEQTSNDTLSGSGGGGGPLIRELDTTETTSSGDGLSEFVQAEKFNWEIPQEMESEDDFLLSSGGAKYGFDNGYSGFVGKTIESGNDINELNNPEQSTPQSRHQERIEKENIKFDSEYYAADFVDSDGIISEIIKYESPQEKLLSELLSSSSSDNNNILLPDIQFSPQQMQQMQNLPHKTYLIDNIKSVYINLVGILFGYSYDLITTQGESTSESSWTIGKLSPNISFLDTTSQTIKELMISCTRRALSYPLYRNWELIIKCWNNVYTLLRLGRRSILSALLEINYLFSHHEIYYIYSKIIIDDYASWIQQANDNVIRSLAHEIKFVKLSKQDTTWDLLAIEQAVLLPDSDDE